jgi:hypothetical protein
MALHPRRQNSLWETAESRWNKLYPLHVHIVVQNVICLVLSWNTNCHVPWRIIMCSGFIDATITVTLNYNHLIRAHSRWLSKTRSVPSWTMSVFSSTVADFSDDRRRLPNCSPGVVRPPFISSGELDRNRLLQDFSFCCSYMRCVGNVCNSVATVH